MPRHQALRARILRDDFAEPLASPPDAADPALAGVVSAVEPVEPVTKRYRATVTRTVTQTALVEFDAPETADLYTMAEALLAQIPADAWVESPAESWGYIDRIEAVESVADPAAPEELLEDDMDLEGGDPEQPEVTAGRSRLARKGVRLVAYRRNPKAALRSVRMPVADALVEIYEIKDKFVSTVSAADLSTAEGIAAYIEQLDIIAAELSIVTVDDDGGTGEAASVQDAIFALLADIEDAMAAADAEAAALQPAY